MAVTGFSIHLKSTFWKTASCSATTSFKKMHFSLMHTFKNLVKHKRSSTCFCGTKWRVMWGEKGKGGKITFKKIYYECACQVYECRVEFIAKAWNGAVKELKGWPWKVCRQNRVSRPAPRLSRYGRITTLFIHFDLSRMHARVLTKDLSSPLPLPVYPFYVWILPSMRHVHLSLAYAWAFFQCPTPIIYFFNWPLEGHWWFSFS